MVPTLHLLVLSWDAGEADTAKQEEGAGYKDEGWGSGEEQTPTQQGTESELGRTQGANISPLTSQ